MSDLNFAPQVQWRVLFHGDVQGVGFRHRTNQIARQHPVTGFVRNLADGTVELAVAGPELAVTRFLSDIDATFRENISEKHVAPFEGLADWPSFSVWR